MGLEGELYTKRRDLPKTGRKARKEQTAPPKSAYQARDREEPRRIIVDPDDVIPPGRKIEDDQPETVYSADTDLMKAELGEDIKVVGRRRVEVTQDTKTVEESLTIRDSAGGTTYSYERTEGDNWSIEMWGTSSGSDKPLNPDVDWRQCPCRSNRNGKWCRHVQSRAELRAQLGKEI